MIGRNMKPPFLGARTPWGITLDALATGDHRLTVQVGADTENYGDFARAVEISGSRDLNRSARVTPDRDPARSAAESPEVEFHFKDLAIGADTPERRPPYRLTAKQLGVAFCMAIAAGAAFAFWTRPVPPPPPDRPLAPSQSDRAMEPAKPVGSAASGGLAGEQTNPPTTKPAMLAMRLESPRASARSGSAADPNRRSKESSAPVVHATRAPSASPAAREPPLRAATEPSAAATVTTKDLENAPSFDCRHARTVSENMVCDDPALALADRVMDQSYEMALAAGVPRETLRAEQDDWRAIRESAARYSRDAVADVYAQRIDELRAMADERIE
jgi:uncharacterized protein YecT (DUF1311 family)